MKRNATETREKHKWEYNTMKNNKLSDFQLTERGNLQLHGPICLDLLVGKERNYHGYYSTDERFKY